MGKIVNTNGFILSKQHHWQSTWYHDKNIQHFIQEDLAIEQYLHQAFLKLNYLSGKLQIRRYKNRIHVSTNVFELQKIHNSTTKKDLNTKSILHNLSKLTKSTVALKINNLNIIDAKIASLITTFYLKRGKPLQYAFSKIVELIQKDQRITGFRIECAGRPKKMDMAKTEWFKLGNIPLHSYKENVDFAQETVILRYGICGIKVWLHCK